MSDRNISRQLWTARGIFIPGIGWVLRIGQFGAALANPPTTTDHANGCLLINIGGGAHTCLYSNEGTGYGAAVDWKAYTTP
ncbi:MAG: hypothetical protein AB1508_19000 [Pseudomonadota bacterium]